MNKREVAPERLEPINEESIRYERAMRVRFYFEDMKKSKREKYEQERNR